LHFEPYIFLHGGKSEMMWTLIVIGLVILMWRFIQPQGSQAAAASAAPPPPPPAASSGDGDAFKSAAASQGGGTSSQSSGEVDPFKAPGT